MECTEIAHVRLTCRQQTVGQSQKTKLRFAIRAFEPLFHAGVALLLTRQWPFDDPSGAIVLPPSLQVNKPIVAHC